MHIGLVTGEFPPMQGGVGAFTQRLAQALANHDVDITIISSRQARPNNVDRKRLKEPINLGYGRLIARGGGWWRKDMHMIADVAMRYELDIVNIQYQAAAYNMRSAWINLLPLRLRGLAASVVTFHDVRTPYLLPKANWLRHYVVRLMAARADGVIATNQQDYAKLEPIQPTLVQIPIGSNIRVHNAEGSERESVRRQYGLAEDDCLLVFFGFINESKGVDTLIAALAQLDERVHLLFVGGQTGASDAHNNAAYLAQIEQQIATRRLNNRVHWTGFVDDRQVSVCLHAADVAVMPYQDGVSLRRGTLMALLSHGCALVTTGDEHSPLQHQQQALLVAPEQPQAVADAVHRVLNDSQLREKLQKNAAEFAKRFGWDAIARDTLAFYRRVLATR